jgi:two-component system, NarL family, nitrate/nitrite response regulator NarL
MSITVIVIDDVALFRTGLSAALSRDGFEVVGEGEDAEAAVTLTGELQPDLVVLDIMMPGLSGLDVVDKVRAASPGCAVVMLTGSESEEDLLDCIRSGARGYLLKDVPFSQLTQSLHDVASGGAAISSTMAGKLLDVVAHAIRHEAFATRGARGRQAGARPAPLRRPGDRRRRPAPRQHRRDEDR